MGRVRVFIACSLDGFIAGPGDDLTWLPAPSADTDYGYADFMREVGALLMGRNTYRVVEGFEGPWPYGDCPVLVATRRPLEPKAGSVRAVQGPITDLVARARAVAGDKDVYLDGGDLIRQGLDADLVDELIVSIVPTILGAGSPLFAGSPRRHGLTLVSSQAFPSGLVQLTLRAR